jgi:hypothetical protein
MVGACARPWIIEPSRLRGGSNEGFRGPARAAHESTVIPDGLDALFVRPRGPSGFDAEQPQCGLLSLLGARDPDARLPRTLCACFVVVGCGRNGLGVRKSRGVNAPSTLRTTMLSNSWGGLGSVGSWHTLQPRSWSRRSWLVSSRQRCSLYGAVGIRRGVPRDENAHDVHPCA